MSKLPAATRDWLAGPGLARLWKALRKRLESNGVQATGSLRLTSVSTQERNDLSLLLGKPVTGTAVTVHLDALDTRLRASAAGLGLRNVVEELGPPLTDRRAVRAGIAARREHIWSSLASALDASPLASTRNGPADGTTCCAVPAYREEYHLKRRYERFSRLSSSSPCCSARSGRHPRPRRTRRPGDRIRTRPGRRHLARTPRPTWHRPRPQHRVPRRRGHGAHCGVWCPSHRTRSPAQC